MTEPIRVLHVDDMPDFVETSAKLLEREDERITVDTATSAEEALETLDDHRYDCVVSDYDMPEIDGIEFLRKVRDGYGDLPFILFTGKGSEEIASEAVSAGITHYLQKRTGSEQYQLLANKVTKAAESYRAKKEVDWHKTVLRNMGEGVYVFDTDYVFHFVNYREQVEGLSEEDWVGRPLSYLVDSGMLSESEVERIKDRADHIFAGETDEVRVRIEPSLPEETHVAELRLTSLQVGERDDLVLGLTRDITERKEREHELRRYRTFIENSSDIIAHLGEDGTLLYQSPGTREVFDHEPGINLGENVFEYVHPEDREHVFEKFADVLSDPETETESVELRLEDDDDDYVWMEATATDQTETEMGGVIVRLRDISERKKRERDLKRQNERLDEFAGVVSHDLQNPLTVAKGRLELAREEFDSEDLEKAAEALDRMAALIDDILTLAREGSRMSDVQPVELGEAAEDCWRNVDTDGATLSLEDEIMFRANRKSLRRLLENLLRNSAEHGSGSGRSASADDDEAEERVTVTVGKTEEGNGFYVADDGPGIPEEEREKVFERGYSGSDDGTGLGLSIVRGVARAHGWKVEFEESRDGGARLEVRGVERVDG